MIKNSLNEPCNDKPLHYMYDQNKYEPLCPECDKPVSEHDKYCKHCGCELMDE